MLPHRAMHLCNNMYCTVYNSRTIFCSILFLLVFISCSNNHDFTDRLTQLDSLMREYPDSALSILQGMEQESENVSKSCKMHYLLSLSDAQNKAYVDFTTDSVMKTVAEYYKKHGSPNEQMRALYLLGCTYRDLKDGPMELQFFQEATEHADTTATDCDYHTLYAIYGQMANIYDSQFLPDEQLKALSMCERIAWISHDTISAISSYELRLRAYSQLNMYDSVLSISMNARQQYLNFGNKQRAARLLGPAVSILLDRKQYDEANKYINIFLTESGCYDSIQGLTPQTLMFYRSMGRYALYKNDISTAKKYFSKLLLLESKEAAYQGLMSIFEKTHQHDSIAKYAKLFAEANDDSYMNMNSSTIEQITAMYNYGRFKDLSEKNAQKLIATERVKTIMAYIIVLMVILLIAAFYAHIIRVRKSVLRINALTTELNNAVELYNQTNAEEEEKRKELTATIESLQQELASTESGIIQQSFKESDIFKSFLYCAQTGMHSITNKEWEEFIGKFYTHFKSYSDYLDSQRSLTDNQKKICILIRLGFRESEMANIMELNKGRINKIKIQINEKFFGESNAKSLRDNLEAHF